MTRGPLGQPAPSLNVAVTGTGALGSGFGMALALGGATVRMWDPDAAAMARAADLIADRIAAMRDAGLLTPDAAQAGRARITFHSRLAAAVNGAVLIQECCPERIEIKHAHLAEIEAAADTSALLASSTSAHTPGRLAEALACPGRFLVAHPANPPFLLPILELVAGPETSEQTMAAAHDVYTRLGMSPVRLGGEIEGFVFNRLQGAVLREAYCLVRDGIASVADVDTVMRLGLGPRWSICGPFETVDLNTPGGIAEHARRMGPAYHRMGLERGQDDPWTPDLVDRVAAERRAALPLDAHEDRIAWRDAMLMRHRAARLRAAEDGPG